MKTFPRLTVYAYVYHALVFYLLSFLLAACHSSGKPPEKDIVKKVEQLEERTGENLKNLLDYAGSHHAAINDSVKLTALALVKQVYEANHYEPVWSNKDQWRPMADSLKQFMAHAKDYGLFPDDYHDVLLAGLRNQIETDSASRKNAALWARADALCTDAYLQLARDLKLGRLTRDSITLRFDSLYNDAFFLHRFSKAAGSNTIISSLQQLEPVYPQYVSIRESMQQFLDTADLSFRTFLPYPFRDSLAFVQLLQQRLYEDSFVKEKSPAPDSAQFSTVIKNYQKSKSMKATGKISPSLVNALNNTGINKFKDIALTLDCYKMLPDSVPETYLLVNIPAYRLYVYNRDTLVFNSKVIVGSPKTRTPQLNGKISNFITYPQWTVPYSIIFRDMLPKIQRDINYLRRQNLMVVDRYDNELDPATINWMKLSDKKFPYLIRQKEGDDNSLGVIKFNFANKYNVYLHDTNARSLFGRSKRALSHGCVRVQQWDTLSHFLVRADTVRYPVDTLEAWMVRQEKHVVTGFPRVPVFIRYFPVDGNDGTLHFYDDIYGYGSVMKQKFFARRRIR